MVALVFRFHPKHVLTTRSYSFWLSGANFISVVFLTPLMYRCKIRCSANYHALLRSQPRFYHPRSGSSCVKTGCLAAFGIFPGAWKWRLWVGTAHHRPLEGCFLMGTFAALWGPLLAQQRATKGVWKKSHAKKNMSTTWHAAIDMFYECNVHDFGWCSGTLIFFLNQWVLSIVENMWIHTLEDLFAK